MAPWLRSIAALAIVVAVYYLAPVGEHPSGVGAALGLALTLLGICALAVLIVVQIRRHLTAGPAARAEGLLTLLYLVVAVFATGYLIVARSLEDQFVGMETKTDALYFTVSTLATVGFGDVHAAGQLARVLVTIQIGFDVVFVAALAATLSGSARERARALARERPGTQPPRHG
jgi:hypothetical protein